ncbi:putative Polycomb group protein ASXL3 [Megalops cyprinoides]|uniref:putative Polycomb group protein ASXL3 n=1 Tax=Megalops cyprinoides TaxID=118141 RepID=UPI0018640243|nr:putative Polycomb group protein ASXL3 [Megalops cyprinoides]
MECPSPKQEHSCDELESEESPNQDDPCELGPQTDDQKPVQPNQSLPEIPSAKQMEEKCLQEDSTPENHQTKENAEETQNDTNAYPLQNPLPETSTSTSVFKEVSCHEVTEINSSVNITLRTEVPKARHYKFIPLDPRDEDRFSVNQVDALKSQEPVCTETKDPENPKRKTGDLHSGICKEKRPRIDDSKSSNSEQTDDLPCQKEAPPKEEPKVPPLKIQLSKVGLPFIVKTQPESKLEPKPSSLSTHSAGRSLGARTLADIKARAQQARALREAAAAAAVAAAARITSGESGPATEGGKAWTLTSIKEQTKAKLIARHQARPHSHSHQRAKGAKQNSTKEDRHSADLQAPAPSKWECSTGVIIANPNRRSPEKGHVPAHGSWPSSETSKPRAAVSASATSVSKHSSYV